MFPQLFHVCPDQHLSQLDKVAVVLVIDLDDTPRICSSTDAPAISSVNLLVATDDSEGDLAGDLLILRNRLLIVIVVYRCLEDADLVVGNVAQDALLEFDDFLVREGISLGNHGDEVDFGVQLTHEFDINLLERVACGLEEIDAGVDTVVDNLLAVDSVLLLEICVEARLDVFQDGLPAVVVVYKVTEPGSVDDGETESNTILLDIYGCTLVI